MEGIDRYALLKLLADGHFHSGTAIGRQLGVSRGAVWNHIKKLHLLDLEIFSVPGRGYRLGRPIELLDRDIIQRYIASSFRSCVPVLEVIREIDSTNRYLFDRAAEGAPGGCVAIAEQQHEGRGRHGRKWVSPFAQNIYLSMLWRFSSGPHELSGLALIFGVAILRALSEFGIDGVGLKWPNDVLWKDRKLGGLLVEMASEAMGPSTVVIGIGMNVHMNSKMTSEIEQPWVDLETVSGRSLSRNRLAGRLITHFLAALLEFEQRKLQPFVDEWQRYDVLQGKTVKIRSGSHLISGIAEGIDSDGALVLNCCGNRKKFYSGDVTLELTPPV